ncbi:MAG TPA: S4 domain-containing protein [Steroidobacteraceae bacterium]|nr:S4 domain-containing protein [Steroidobacteraceae bacterium]
MRARDGKSSDDLTTSRTHELEAEGLRVDKWLWFARFFKSRSPATDAVAGGLVHINGERAKPARAIRIGDTLAITRGESNFEVIVQKLLERRGPAPEAQAAYTETAASIAQREQKREQHRHAAPAPFGRPNKHERRALRNLRGRPI